MIIQSTPRQVCSLVVLLFSLFTLHPLLPVHANGITFEDGTRADPFGKGQITSLRLLFNNMVMEGSKDYPKKMSAQTTGIGVFYAREGREFGLTAYGFGGIALGVDHGTDKDKTAILKSRAYMVEVGADLNYIFLNADRWFLSAGVAGHAQIGGMTVDQIKGEGESLRLGIVPFTVLLGLDARLRFFGFEELYFTGYLSWAFLSVHAKELQGRASGNDNNGPVNLTAVDVEGPSTVILETSVQYRPTPTFAFHGGVRYRTLSYTSDDLMTNTPTVKTLTEFIPFIGITYLY